LHWDEHNDRNEIVGQSNKKQVLPKCSKNILLLKNNQRMKTSSNKPTVTKKFPIEVPTHQYHSHPSIFKILFGKKYLIWKGKSLLQSCEYIAESIERYIRLNKNDDTDYLYHVVNHIKKTRVIKATVEVVCNDFVKTTKSGSESINGYAMLVEEQKLLDKAAKDPDCLNNNAIAYTPKWIKADHLERFEKWSLKKHHYGTN
jgi:hypothetical protein